MVGQNGAAAEDRQGDGARYLAAWFLFVGSDGELSEDRGAARISIGATRAGRVRVVVPEGIDLAPAVAERIAARVAEAAFIAREPEARFAPGARAPMPIADADGDTAEVWVPVLDPQCVRVKADVLLPAAEARKFAASVLRAASGAEARAAAIAPGDGTE